MGAHMCECIGVDRAPRLVHLEDGKYLAGRLGKALKKFFITLVSFRKLTSNRLET